MLSGSWFRKVTGIDRRSPPKHQRSTWMKHIDPFNRPNICYMLPLQPQDNESEWNRKITAPVLLSELSDDYGWGLFIVFHTAECDSGADRWCGSMTCLYLHIFASQCYDPPGLHCGLFRQKDGCYVAVHLRPLEGGFAQNKARKDVWVMYQDKPEKTLIL